MKITTVVPSNSNTSLEAPKRCDHTMNHAIIDGESYFVLYGGKNLVVVPGYEGAASVGYDIRFRFKSSRDVYLFHIGNLMF